MCNFYKLTNDEKQKQHKELLECANSFGGINFYLQLLEAIRDTKPNPIISNTLEFKMEYGKVIWNKVIFKDKLETLLQARTNESKQDNLLQEPDTKGYKKTLNTIRTLKPIKFKVIPKDRNSGDGFTFNMFDIISNDKTKLNLVFDATFFCSIDMVKKILTHKC